MSSRNDQGTTPEPEDSTRTRSNFEAIGEGGRQIGGEADAEIDLSSALGASAGLSTQALRLWIPNRDRRGRRIWRHGKWVREAAELLAKMGGGVTIMPPVRGGWYDEENDRIVWENPVIVFTYVKPRLFQLRLRELRRFLHRLGRETNQGEIAFEFDGLFFRIHDYDQSSETDHGPENQSHE